MKESWAHELASFYPFYVLRKTENSQMTRLEQKIRKREFIRGLRQSLIATCVMILVGASVLLLKKEIIVPYVKYTIFLSNLFCYGIIFYNLIINNFAYKKEFVKLKFSIYHWRTYFAFGLSGLALQLLPKTSSWITNINAEFYYNISILFVMFLCLIYTGITQFKFAKILSKIKPTLKFV